MCVRARVHEQTRANNNKHNKNNYKTKNKHTGKVTVQTVSNPQLLAVLLQSLFLSRLPKRSNSCFGGKAIKAGYRISKTDTLPTNSCDTLCSQGRGYLS